MQITVYKCPCLLLEAAELVYAYVNHISVEKLAGTGAYCIPAEEVLRIQEEACAEINPEDEAIQFYFHGVPVEGSERLSCICACLLYTGMDIRHSEAKDMVESLLNTWATHQGAYRIMGLSGFGLALQDVKHTPEKHFFSLTAEVGKLPLPNHYQLQLVEVLANYEVHLQYVADLLAPIITALERLLSPWVTRALPFAQQWEAFLEKASPKELKTRFGQLRLNDCKSISMAMRFFSPGVSPGVLQDPEGQVRIHMGVAQMPIPATTEQRTELFASEYTALRLLSSPDRVRMLQAMLNQSMCIQDLSQSLKINPGSVFRDLSSLYNAQLIYLDNTSGKGYYRTNLPAIEQVSTKLLQFIRKGLSEQVEANK